MHMHNSCGLWMYFVDAFFCHYIGYSKSYYGDTVYPKKYAHGFCFAMLCCGYTVTDFPISIRLTSLALWQSKDCPSASKATLMNVDKYFMWIHYERLHNHNKAKHNKTVCIFLGIYCNTIIKLSYIREYFSKYWQNKNFILKRPSMFDKIYSQKPDICYKILRWIPTKK